jgi:hypothetical protein
MVAAITQRARQQSLIHVRISCDKSQQSRHVGSNHSGAFCHAADNDFPAGESRLDRNAFGKRVGRHNRARRLVSAPRMERTGKRSDPLLDAVDWQQHADCAGRGDGDLIGRDPKTFSRCSGHGFGVPVPLLAGHSISVAAVGDHRPQASRLQNLL